ncbi:tRNA (adenosine(37)-N6)-dimethylallyltransferase MiaA [Anaerobacillus sp. MEB173]|uniref:tRNA (adenosine(37)-N6)-dimethylallyltransferase MiaA n=1 Tax=Anaerobacillus sp. MEB173 TaxID=3383345 RepID=UPI003F9265C3
MKEKLLVIVGPTAVGKTKTGIELAKEFKGEVISGDSMQIYKGMDIGTAKVTYDEMEGVPHHLIDIKEPTESFSVAEFQSLTKPLICQINERRHLPIIVGGTGLYIQAVTHDYQFADAPSDEEYRLQLEAEVEEHGVEFIHQKLKTIDRESYERIHPNNYRRVIRALEIYHSTNKTMTQYIEEQHKDSPYDLLIIGLVMERELLYERINKRVDLMVENGLIEEAQRLYGQGVRHCQSVQAIGYKEIYDYIEGRLTKEDAIELLKRNSRRYAKRQFTWFRNKMDVEWFNMDDDFNKKIAEIKKNVAGKLL